MDNENKTRKQRFFERMAPDSLFDADLLKYAQVFRAAAGDHGPVCRLLQVDYKDRDGVDHYQDIAVGVNRDMSDERLAERIREQYAALGFSVSAVSEMTETAPRVLYVKPGFMEECIEESGLPVPQDIAAALSYVGAHPVNMAELAGQWKGEAAP